MRVLVVDDERLARAELRALLAGEPDLEVVGEAASAAAAREAIARELPDLLLLDVQMPAGSGFDLLASLPSPPLTIFTTAHDQHALRAFEVSAVDYLLKPVEPKRLSSALAKARARLGPSRSAAAGLTRRLFVRDGERVWLVDVDEVPLFESEGNYARIHLGREQPLLLRSLNQLEEQLDPAQFFRANRRQLINLKQIAQLRSGIVGLSAELKTGQLVEISRRQAQRLRELWK